MNFLKIILFTLTLFIVNKSFGQGETVNVGTQYTRYYQFEKSKAYGYRLVVEINDQKSNIYSDYKDGQFRYIITFNRINTKYAVVLEEHILGVVINRYHVATYNTNRGFSQNEIDASPQNICSGISQTGQYSFERKSDSNYNYRIVAEYGGGSAVPIHSHYNAATKTFGYSFTPSFSGSGYGSVDIVLVERYLNVTVKRYKITTYTMNRNILLNTRLSDNRILKSNAVNLEQGFATQENILFHIEINDCGYYAYREGEFEVHEESDAVFDDNVNDFFAYPNPISRGKLNFGKIVSSFQLYDQKGAMVKSGEDADGFYVDNLTRGLYLLKTDTKTEKIIIQ